MNLKDVLSGIDDTEKKQGIEYAMEYIKDRSQLDRLGNLSKEEMILLVKFYTIAEMFGSSSKEKQKYHNVLEKYLALSTSKVGFGMTKIVDMFKSDIQYSQEMIRKE